MQKQNLRLRPVHLDDAAELTRIYNYYIKNTIITFELHPIDELEFADRIKKITSVAKYPFFVLEEIEDKDDSAKRDGASRSERQKLLGYAYGNKFRERAAYDATAELSVYLDHEMTGSRKGLGTLLYTAVLDHLKAHGVREAIGGISCPNPASFAFHEKLGFKKVGVFEKVGYKFDSWIDVAFYQLHLS